MTAHERRDVAARASGNDWTWDGGDGGVGVLTVDTAGTPSSRVVPKCAIGNLLRYQVTDSHG